MSRRFDDNLELPTSITTMQVRVERGVRNHSPVVDEIAVPIDDAHFPDMYHAASTPIALSATAGALPENGDIGDARAENSPSKKKERKKTVRLLLDPETELTEEELKASLPLSAICRNDCFEFSERATNMSRSN